jgi:hypothetical protein
MLHRTCSRIVYACLLNIFIVLFSLILIPVARSYADNTSALSLNRAQGPLGVTLTLSGNNFPPGIAKFSYIDSQNVPGFFVYPSDTSVQVQATGSFVTSNLVLPGSGAVGPWKIVVQDSLGSLTRITYTVLAAPGQSTAGTPTFTLNPSSGMSGDAITFTGANWLPMGTAVNLQLQAGTSSIPLLEPAPLSDINGNISGTFHLPTNLTASTATVMASDVTSGALRAQSPITITATTLTPTPTTTPTASPTSTTTPSSTTTTTTPSPVTASGNTNTGGPDNPGSPLGKPDAALWGPVLLVVGGILAVAALMLILFMIPWAERDTHSQRGRQY